MPAFDTHFAARVRNRLGLPLAGYRDFERPFTGCRGVEIGGPSELFMRRLPIYGAAQSVDQINFSANNVWREAAESSRFKSAPALCRGKSIICDGTNLRGIGDGHYDFLLSCHNLEHIANPLKALSEWSRVVRSGGHLLLIVPNKHGNFDHRRPHTAFEHLLEDQQRDVDEGDLTHLAEILALHDLARDPAAGNSEQFQARSLRNSENRCLHHHVFSLELTLQVLRHIGLEPLHHTTTFAEFIAVGRKP